MNLFKKKKVIIDTVINNKNKHKEIIYNNKKYYIPTCLEDLTFNQFIWVMNKDNHSNNDIILCGYFTGMLEEEVLRINDFNFYTSILKTIGEMMSNVQSSIVKYIDDIDEVKIMKSFEYNNITYNIPNDLLNLNVRVFEHSKKLISKYVEDESIKTIDGYLNCCYDIVYSYLGEVIITDGSFEFNDETKDQYKDLPLIFIIQFGSFFLKKLNDVMTPLQKTLKKEMLIANMQLRVTQWFKNRFRSNTRSSN